jgi:hypothetical protein
MRLFGSPRRTQRVQVSRRALVISVMFASFPLLAQGPRKGTTRGTPDFLSHRTDRWALHFTEMRARKTRRRFFCCTDYPLRPGCSSLSSTGFPIAITS